MQISQSPHPIGLMLQAALKRAGSHIPSILPDLHISLPDQTINAKQLLRFNRVVGWDDHINPSLHPCFLHVLAFPLHLTLMLNKACPFPLLGLVHLQNEIRQIRPVKPTESVNFLCQFGQLQAHAKGWLFSIVTEVTVGSELVWQSTSTNLYRTEHGKLVEDPGHKYRPILSGQVQRWQLDSDLGRRYAKASGDFNPIHLYGLTAKTLGFKRAIVHGMWSKARLLSALQSQLAESFSCGCQFIKPLFLPGQAELISEKHGHQLHFSLVDSQKAEAPIIHLCGVLSP